jgi:hypothetical protein
MKKSPCLSCRTFIKRYDKKNKTDWICLYRKYHMIKQCPCRQCIVKPMCNHACKDFYLLKIIDMEVVNEHPL